MSRYERGRDNLVVMITSTEELTEALNRIEKAGLAINVVRPHDKIGGDEMYLLIDTTEEDAVRAAMGEVASAAVDDSSECQGRKHT